MTLNDETLLRYADGLLDPQATASVAAALAKDDVAAERLRLMQVSATALSAEAMRPLSLDGLGAYRSRLESLARQPASMGPEAHAASIRPTVSRSSIARRAMAAMMLLALGMGAGVLATTWSGSETSRHPVWVMRVVDYHTLYGRSTVDGSVIDASTVKAMEQRFSKTLGGPVTIPVFAAADMELRRGQVLEFEREPIIQLAYLPPGLATPVAICLKRGTGGDLPETYERVHGIGMVRWRLNSLDYVLVGDQAQEKLEHIARTAITQIRQGQRI